MNATLHAFPPLHAFNSPRSWFLALIVLLHLGFFWALTHGLSIGSIEIKPKISKLVPVPSKPVPPPPQRPITPVDVEHVVFVPPTEIPRANIDEREETAPRTGVTQEVPTEAPPRETPGSGPVVVEPRADPRHGLAEPLYPPPEIRQQHTGTVLLSIEVLPNGRVGQVRVEQSSGYPRLDESAVREARTWRLLPGTRDGVAVAMWKQVPITFRLKD